MADDLVHTGAVGGIVALVSAVAGGIGAITRLQAAEAKLKNLGEQVMACRHDLDEVKDQLADEVKDLTEEIATLRKEAASAKTDVRSMLRAEFQRTEALIRAELGKLDEKFAAIRERLGLVDGLIRGLKLIEKLNDRRSHH